MRDYAKISPQFWTGATGKKIRSLGRDAQVTAFYLMTCPSANMLGLYYLPLPTLCHETGSPSKGALKALRSLSEGGFAHYDEHSETVFVPEMARFQIGEHLVQKDNRHKAVVRELETLKKSPFFKDFVERYAEDFELPAEQLLKGLPSPSEAPSKPGTGTGTGTGERAGTGESSPDNSPGSDSHQRAAARATKRCPEKFEVTAEMREWAARESPSVDVDAETAAFRDWEFKSARSDWPATWRNWLRKAQTNRSAGSAGPQRNQRQLTKFERIFGEESDVAEG